MSDGPTNVRFPKPLADEAKRIAESEGLTLSEWIRRQVDHATELRQAPTDTKSRLYRAMHAFAPWVIFARQTAPGSDWATRLQDAYDDLLELSSDV